MQFEIKGKTFSSLLTTFLPEGVADHQTIRQALKCPVCGECIVYKRKRPKLSTRSVAATHLRKNKACLAVLLLEGSVVHGGIADWILHNPRLNRRAPAKL